MHVGRGVLQTLQDLVPELRVAHRIAIITDDNVGPRYARRLIDALGEDRTVVVSVAPGEMYKTRETWARITDVLLNARLGRDSIVIALGGGVIGDLAGFVASTFMRGVPIVQAPTTLLAMVDASIGGKTGVDSDHGKNLIGSFHRPLAVISDLETLDSLPPPELVNGLAEALKHGVVADAEYFDAVANIDLDAPDWRALVFRSVEIKAGIVAADEREAGLRKVLNYGHTIGHAVERLMEFTVPHGACIAYGMLVEARIGVALGLSEPPLVPALLSVLDRFGLPTTRPAPLTAEAIVDATAGDKKSRGGTVEYALPARCGAMTGEDRGYGTAVSRAIAVAALEIP